MLKVLVICFEEAAKRLSTPLHSVPAVEVHRAETGFEALELAEGLRPQIAILNLDATGPDGLEVLRNLKEIDPDIQVIAAAEHGGPELQVRALELGACDFFPSSVVEAALCVSIQRAAEKVWLRNKLEEALQEIQKRYDFEHKLVHTSMDGIIANDRSGRIILFNEGASRIYGYTPQEALTRLHATDLYPKGEARKIKKKIYGPDYGGPGRLINYEVRAITRENRLIPILLSAVLIQEGDQEVGTVGYFKDLTEIRRQSARLLAVDQGVAEMAHALRDILHGLKLGAFIVEKELKQSGSERLQHGWKLLTRNMERISRLTLNLLGYARTESGERDSIALNDLVEEVCDSLVLQAQEKGILLERDLVDGLPHISADAVEIRSCLHQLVRNAMEAIPESAKGSVILRTRSADHGRVSLEVEDTGKGISPELQDKIFEPFFTTKGGTGLGLAIVTRIIREHQGSIQVRSQPGQGTTFTLFLPSEAG